MATQLEAIQEEILPTPPDRAGYTWRPLGYADLPSLYEMLLAVDRADGTEEVDTLADIQTQFGGDPWINPETDSLVGLTSDGQVVAQARTFMNPEPEEEIRAFMWTAVHPAHRMRGMEEFVLDWAIARGMQRLKAMPHDLPRVLREGVADHLTHKIKLLERCGFEPIRYFYHMRRDLHQPIPDAPLPEDLTLRTFTPELSEAARNTVNEAFRDHWSFETIIPLDWETFFIKSTTFRPDLTFIALDGDEMAGVSFNAVSVEENARNGVNEGWIKELAVRRPWRKRGVASALLCASMRAFKADGLDFARLGVDTENPSGALGLYERLGFKSFKRFTVFEKRIK